MNEAWKEHIQPILDSWEWDHFSWVWDPFLAKYPNFNSEQRTQIENALVICAFDSDDEKLAIKALSIAENLHRLHLATLRLSELFRSELRKQLETFPLDREISQYYVFAFSTFELTEAIPFIKSVINHLEKGWLENTLDERKDSYRKLFRACCLSLLLLKDDTAMLFFVRLIEHDLRIRTLDPTPYSMSPFDLISFWSYIGSNGLRTIAKKLQVWQKEKLLDALPLLIMASEKIHYRDSQENQEVKMLIENLRNGVVVT